MSNNAPDYKDNLAFEPKEYSAPYCDILELKGEIRNLKILRAKQDKELQQLRELLKECYSKFTRYQVDGAEPTYKELVEMCTKINSVIGESEE